MLLVEVMALVFGPAALAVLVARLPAVVRWIGDVAQRLHPAPPRPQGPPIQQIAADLRRISGRLDELVAAGPIPGRILRVRATTAAYDDKLVLACRALDVLPAGTNVPMSSAERLQTEAALVAAGLIW